MDHHSPRKRTCLALSLESNTSEIQPTQSQNFKYYAENKISAEYYAEKKISANLTAITATTHR